MSDQMRTFDSGATRNLDDSKLDFEGFLSPLVLERYAQYMHKHRKQADGKLRDSDNWQKGIPLNAYMKSGYRHFIDWWKEHRGISTAEGLEDSLCALMFNAIGYLHEVLRTQQGLGVWMAWEGGELPPLQAIGRRTELRMRNGTITECGVSAECLSWLHYGGGGDIIAYRVVKEGE